jgi:hypothetical protein
VRAEWVPAESGDAVAFDPRTADNPENRRRQFGNLLRDHVTFLVCLLPRVTRRV